MNLKLFLILIALLSSCGLFTSKKPSFLIQKDGASINFNDSLSYTQLITGIKNNITILRKKKTYTLKFKDRIITSKQYADALNSLIIETKDIKSFIQQIKKDFIFLSTQDILLTSYYEPIIKGSRKKTSVYSQPLYRKPKNLLSIPLKNYTNLNALPSSLNRRILRGRISNNTIIPYFNRSEIDEQNKLAGLELELFYVDPIEAFFLQIQGSGTIQIDDQFITVGYHAQNGHKYQAIGKYLTHLIPKKEMSLQKIEAYLKTLNKKDLYKFLSKNPSYVFFRKLKGRPITNFTAEVIDRRTIAVDPSIYPLGALAFLEYKSPRFKENEKTPSKLINASNFVLAQDTGGAIKGSKRIDLFWGRGAAAKKISGHMKYPSNVYFLFPILHK